MGLEFQLPGQDRLEWSCTEQSVFLLLFQSRSFHSRVFTYGLTYFNILHVSIENGRNDVNLMQGFDATSNDQKKAMPSVIQRGEEHR